MPGLPPALRIPPLEADRPGSTFTILSWSMGWPSAWSTLDVDLEENPYAEMPLASNR